MWARKATFLTKPLALEAIRLVGRHLRRAYANGGDMEARTGMLNASLLAGLAFSNTQTGAAHACGMALGAEFHIPHGVSTAIMLPAVMTFNSLACPEKFAAIARALGENTDGMTLRMAAKKAVQAALDLTCDLGFAMGLKNYGVSASHIPMLAQKAIGPAQRLWDNNPRAATAKDVEKLFEAAFGAK